MLYMSVIDIFLLSKGVTIEVYNKTLLHFKTKLHILLKFSTYQ